MATEKEIIDRLKNAGKQELINASRVFTASLAASTDSLKPPNIRITEDLFKREFLPFIIGEREDTATESLYGSWVGVGALPTSEIDVCDNVGNVLFSIPALWDTSADRISAVKPALNTMVRGYTTYNRVGQGNSFLMAHMPAAVFEINGGEKTLSKAVERLRVIVGRYRPDIVTVDKKAGGIVPETWMEF